jgi:hypothetical protein
MVHRNLSAVLNVSHNAERVQEKVSYRIVLKLTNCNVRHFIGGSGSVLDDTRPCVTSSFIRSTVYVYATYVTMHPCTYVKNDLIYIMMHCIVFL